MKPARRRFKASFRRAP